MDTVAFSPESYCRDLQEALLEAFGSDLLYMGLQGSYLRGTLAGAPRFCLTKRELLEALSGQDREILSRQLAYGSGAAPDFPGDYARLLAWCQHTQDWLGELQL